MQQLERRELFAVDFGDAPAPYPTTLASDGARHILDSSAIYLGTATSGVPDAENDGAPTEQANGDNVVGTDDERGVLEHASLVLATGTPTVSSFAVQAAASGKLDAWIDFNRDGDWRDDGEQIASSLPVALGVNWLRVEIPDNALAGATYARFRLSSEGGLTTMGEAADGEVEDYRVELLGGDMAADVLISQVEQVTTEVSQSAGQWLAGANGINLFAAPIESVRSFVVEGGFGDDTVELDLASLQSVPPEGFFLAGGLGNNTLNVRGDEGVLDLTDEFIVVDDYQHLDMSSPDATTVILNADIIATLSIETADLSVTGGEGDRLILTDADRWRMSDPNLQSTPVISVAVNIQDGVSIQASWTSVWQNLIRSGDINNSGTVSAQDALDIINELNDPQFSQPASGQLVDPATVDVWPRLYFDQNGDRRVSALDALLVINELNGTPSPNSEPIAWPMQNYQVGVVRSDRPQAWIDHVPDALDVDELSVMVELTNIDRPKRIDQSQRETLEMNESSSAITDQALVALLGSNSVRTYSQQMGAEL